MIKTYTIDDAQYQRICDGVCYQYGYRDLIDDKPNPQSKDDFFDEVTYNFWKNNVAAYETNNAVKTAQANTLDSLKTITIGTSPKGIL